MKKCTGCGTCQEICTQNNIELVNNKPSWSDHCINCFASALTGAPMEPISLGDADLGFKNYHHPEVEMKDMILPKK
jgi:coenzyme F420-reducing hydrogenase beta subunit